jgi:FMN phosphatase YigB (HAD superfamily)
VIRAVYFDIGETVLDRTREYAALADALGVPRHTFSAVFGGTVVRGGGIRDTLRHFTDEPWGELRRRVRVPPIGYDDLYDDVVPCLERLRGYRVGLVGNQPADVAIELRALSLRAATVATSDSWGVAKPAAAFFERIAADAGCPPDQIVYVGDQLDNDVVPALAAGMQAVRVLRGPWGHLIRDAEQEARCLAVLPDLSGLPAVLKDS